jgi:hypothetical protein
MPVNSNADRLVTVSVTGQITAPGWPGVPAEPYLLDAEGHSYLLPFYGGLVFNVSVGDSAYGWLADCVHPSVSIGLKDEGGNRALNTLACVGNTAVVLSGDAKGTRGIVTGKSGRFSDQVIIHFDRASRRKMAVGDRIQIRASGAGLALTAHPEVHLKSCSAELLNALNLTTGADGKLVVPVVAVVPSHLIGAGAGLTSEGGSLHIQTGDRQAVAEAGLDALRLGDLVALADYDSTWNHGYLKGAVGIGVIGQGDSPRAGYGPGITLLMTSATGKITPVIQPDTNLKNLLGLSD